MARLGRSFPQKPVYIHGDLSPAAPAGPTTITRSITEASFGFSDTLNRSFWGGRGNSDELALTDALGRGLIRGRGPSDTLNLTETLTRAVWYGRDATDSQTFTDTLSRGLWAGRLPSESFTFIDSYGQERIYGRTPTDTFVFSDSLTYTLAADSEATIHLRTIQSAFDDFGLDDQLYRGIHRPRSVTDTLSFSDVVSTSKSSASYWQDSVYGPITWRRLEPFSYSQQATDVALDMAPIISSFPFWYISSSTASTIQLNSEQAISASTGLP